MGDRLLELRQTARQIVFRTGSSSTPIGIGGTYFLTIYRGRYFAITARHVVAQSAPEQLLLYIHDSSSVPVRILEEFSASDEDSGPLDLVVYELDVRHITAKYRRAGRAYGMRSADLAWFAKRDGLSFFLFGYPLSRSQVDYGALTTQTSRDQLFFNASYRGPSELANCHILELTNPLGLDDLNGLSGSPVFAFENRIGFEADPIFAGVVLRGSARSKLVHFLEGAAVRVVMDCIVSRPRRKLPKKWRGLKTKLRRAPTRHE